MTEEENTPTETTSAKEQTKSGQFGLQRIYVKDLSFEAPNGILAAKPGFQPKLSQDLGTNVNKVGEDLYEVVLSLTVTVKTEDDSTAFLVEVHQAGLFAVKGLEGGPLQHILSSQCPQMLFPYVRELVDSLVVRGGFPPLMLPPINFDALFAQAVAQAKQKAQAEAEAATQQ